MSGLLSLRLRRQPIRLMTREEAQVLMDILIKNFVHKKKGCPDSQMSVEEIELWTGVSKRALYNYIHHLKRDRNFNPKDHHTAINRAMSDKLELELVMEIEETYIKPGYYFNNRVLKCLAIAMWNKSSAPDRLLPEFKASNKWCRNFRKRHNYVWRKARALKRPRLNGDSGHKMKSFILEMQLLSKSLNDIGQLDLLVNMDETSWRICYAGDMTWAKKGSKSVKINVNHDVKTTLTALASITANGQKLPLYILAKGKTHVAENNQVAGIPGFEYKTDRSKSGWTTTEVMIRYLKWLRSFMNQIYSADDKTIHLVIDTYSVHKSDKIKAIAHEQNIRLHYVPIGFTDLYQPLDIKVFGALKAKARGYWYTNYALNPSEKYSKRSAVKTLLTCWDQLSEDVVKSAWHQYSTLISQESHDEDIYNYMDLKGIDDTREELIEEMERMKKQDPQMIKTILQEFNEEDIDCESERNVMITTETELFEEEEDHNDLFFDKDEYLEDEREEEEESITNVVNFDDVHDFEEYQPKSVVDGGEYAKDHERINDPILTNQRDDIIPEEALQEPFDEIIITGIDSDNLQTDLLQTHIKFEQFRHETRVTNALRAKKEVPKITETVGLTNMGASCAFNSFLQIVHLMPDHRAILLNPESDPSHLTEFALLVLDQMGKSHQWISMDHFIKSLNGKTPYLLSDIVNLISNLNNSIINFITQCIDKAAISFIKFGTITRFLQIDVDIAFEYSFRGVDPSSLGKYLFALTSKTQNDFKFPLQLLLDDRRSQATLVLKAVIANPLNHFLVYIRKQFTEEFLRADDYSVQPCKPKNMKRCCMALYIVCKH